MATAADESPQDLTPQVKTLAPQLRPPPPNDRLSIPFTARLPITVLVASIGGFALGAAQGGTMTGLRFRAENAHRLPTSQVGWYLYHKSKNYHIALGGIKEGLRMGFRLGFWTGSFFCMEEAVDRLRGAVVRNWVGFKERRREEKAFKASGGRDYEEEQREMGLEKVVNERDVWVQRDFLSTIVAALGTAGGFSAWNRFPVQTAARTATIGLKYGFVFGITQDLLGLIRGRRLGYVEFVKRHLFGKSDQAGALA
ncbi:hypothetical protein MBLNU459_g4313t1 [Dothideomycetes sp. NU459]